MQLAYVLFLRLFIQNYEFNLQMTMCDKKYLKKN